MRLNYAIVLVSDMAKSIAFYRDAVGLPLRFETPEWTEFATEGALLALQQAGEPPQAGAEPGSNQAGQCRPAIAVADLDAFHEQAIAGGVRCWQAPKAMFGTRIAQYLDPDGLLIFVSEQRGASEPV